jgi:hypothetical protein
MKFKKLGSNKTVDINISKYLIRAQKLKNASKPEQTVWDFLYPYWKNQVVLCQFMIPGSRMRLDLFNVTKGVCIEISPEATHGKFNKFFHGTPQTGYLASIKRDMDKLQWIEDNGFKYVELDDECINNLSKKMFEEKFGIIL